MVMASFLHRGTSAAKRTGRPRKERVIVRTISRLMAVVLLVLGLSTGKAFASGLDIRLGAYLPSADSDLFQDINSLYARGATFGNATPPGVQKSDWHGFFGGIEYNHKVAKNVELGVSIEGYGKHLDTSYRDYVREDDSPIQQTLHLSVIPVGLSVRFVPTSRNVKFAPFVVLGVDAMVYKYEEFGDFVDFFAPDQPIVPDSFISDGVGFGFHAGGGLRFGVSDDVSVVTEGRYFWSKKDMGDDFSQNRIDLGGWALTAGVHIRF